MKNLYVYIIYTFSINNIKSTFCEMSNNRLYNKMIRNISHSVKRALDEKIERFNPADYDSSEFDILDQQEIRNTVYKYRPTSNEELRHIIIQKTLKDSTYIDLSDIDVTNVTDMTRLFQNTELVYIDLSSWDTSNVTNMSSMFYGCNELRKVNMRGLNTSNVFDMSYMFWGCGQLNDVIGLENLDGKQIKNLTCMFRDCKKLEEVDLSGFNSSPRSVGSMFYGCTQLKSVKMGNVKGTDLAFSTLSPVEYIFNKCKKLEYVELSKSLNTAIVLNRDPSLCKYVLKNK